MTQTAVQTALATWQIDPSHSTVEFAVKHLVFTTQKGRFSRVSGALRWDGADFSTASVEAEIDAASVETHDPQRDEHLRSADFFDAERYPTLTFRSTRVVPKGGDRFQLIGDLTIRGVTREVVLEAELGGQGGDPWGNYRAGFSATTAIDRREFGLTWNAALETGGVLVGDQVKINLEIEAIRQ